MYRGLLAVAAFATILALGAGTVTASRVVSTTTVTPETRNRDIVLCLDVSGSMINFDAQLLTLFEKLASKFAGERIGLVLFDGSPLPVFPLTTDYEFIRAQMVDVAKGLRHAPDGYSYKDGTDIGRGFSLVGDGVAGCVLQFDKQGEERSRTLIVATDNQAGDGSLLPLPDAAELASTRGVAIYGLNPDHEPGKGASTQFQSETESNGGRYYAVDNEADAQLAISDIVQSVTSDPATVVTESPVRTTADQPDIYIWILAALTLLVFLLVWRLRL